jgi:replicative superfamily II helicase
MVTIQSDDISSTVLKSAGFSKYFFHQERAINFILENPDSNFILKAPTGSGKTLIAANLIEKTLRERKKVVYAVPSRRLAKEKVDELRKIVPSAAAVGLAGTSNYVWQDSDIVVGTFEGIYRALLLSRRLLFDFSLAVLDDFHTLYETKRGRDLEKLITLLKVNGVQILALSATIEPLDRLAEWLHAKILTIPDDVRPIEIEKEVVVTSDRIKTLVEFDRNPNLDILPCIVFNATKPYTESRAKNFAKTRELKTPVEEVERELEELKGDALDEDDRDLTYAIARGVGWHHADIPEYSKELVEKLFATGELDYLFCTTTYAHGVNTPARAVMIMDIYRSGDPIPVFEWLQMAGRAGRAGKTSVKKAKVFTLVNREDMARYVEEHYHTGQLEPVKSQLSNVDAAAKTIMELIYTRRATDDALLEFFRNTYLHEELKMNPGTLLGLRPSIEVTLRKALQFLYGNGFITVVGSEYALTPFSKAIMKHFWERNTEFTLEEIISMRRDIQEYSKLTHADALFVLMSNVHWLNIRYPKKVVERVLTELEEPVTGTFADSISVNTHIILNHWIQGDDIERLKNRYGENVFYLKSRARQIASALHIVRLIAELEGVQTPPDFDTFIKRVEFGVTKYELPLVEVKGFGRKIVHNLYLTMRIVAATSKYVDKDEHIGITLKRIYDQHGPERLKSFLEDMHVPGLGPKRVQKIIEWISRLGRTTGLDDTDNNDLKVRRGNLSDWF